MKKLILIIGIIVSLIAIDCIAQVMVKPSLTSSRYVDAIWDFDSNGDVMPSVSGGVDPFFEVDTRLDIQPKNIAYQQDTNGDVQPIN